MLNVTQEIGSVLVYDSVVRTSDWYAPCCQWDGAGVTFFADVEKLISRFP